MMTAMMLKLLTMLMVKVTMQTGMAVKKMKKLKAFGFVNFVH